MLSITPQDPRQPPPPTSQTRLQPQDRPVDAAGDESPSSLSASSSSRSLSSDSGSSSVMSSNAVNDKAAVDLDLDESSSSSTDDEDADDGPGASTTATTIGISLGTDDSAILSDEFGDNADAVHSVDFYGLGDDVTACLGLLASTGVPEDEATFLADFLTRPPLPKICGLGAVIQRLRRIGATPANPLSDTDSTDDPMSAAVESLCQIGSPDAESLLRLLLDPHLAALWSCLLRLARPPPEPSLNLEDFQEIDISSATISGNDSPDAGATVPLRRQQQPAVPPPRPPPAAFRRSVVGSAGAQAGRTAASAAQPAAPELFTREVTLLKAADQPLGFTAVLCVCPVSTAAASASSSANPDGNDGTASSSSLAASPRQAIAVARVLAGSQADTAGRLRVGDIIREANGQPMETPEALQRLLRQTVGRVTLRIESETPPETPLSPPPPPGPEPRLLRACFNYQPERDPLLPSPELGLQFRHGDVLEVVDQLDPAYWQARPVGRPRDPARLIPSQMLEERRKAFFPASRIVPGPAERLKHLYTKLQPHKPIIYRAQSAAEFDRTELAMYEDVARLSPSPVPLLVLCSPNGAVGRNLVRRWLCRQYPLKFAATRWTTSDPERCGSATAAESGDLEFSSKQEMLKAIAEGEFVEFQKIGDETGGNLVGLSVESVRASISTGAAAGLTIVLDCHPSAIRRLRRAEFRPLVLFLATPDVSAQQELLAEAKSLGLVPESADPGTEQQLQEAVRQSVKLEKLYRHLFDSVMLCDSLSGVQTEVLNALATAEAEGRWVPAEWVEPEM